MYIGFADVGCLFGELLFVFEGWLFIFEGWLFIFEGWLFLLRIDCFFCVLAVNSGGCPSLFD